MQHFNMKLKILASIHTHENCLQLSSDLTQRQIEMQCMPSYTGLKAQLKPNPDQQALEILGIASMERIARSKTADIRQFGFVL